MLHISYLLLLLVLAIASACDIKTRKIPNGLILTGLVTGVFTGRNSHKTFRSVILILFRNASPDGNGGYQVVDGDPFISWLCKQLFYCSNSSAFTDPLCNLEKPFHHKGYLCFFSILSLHEKEY